MERGVGKEPVCRAERGGVTYLLFCTNGGEYGFSIRRGEEIATLRHVTTKSATANELFDLLVRFTVHPCHLADVVEDFLIDGK
ncbi:MAG: hypothetical protein IJF24_01405 [Clostridia bacterium]|nr:hypothetical protein [Clostridia bacterium]